MQALRIENLKKTYPNGTVALEGISFEVCAGDFFFFLLRKGAGKSTAIGITASLINKSSGKVKIFGHDIDTHKDNAKKEIGIVPQEFNFNIFEKVIDIVVNQAGFYGIPKKHACNSAEKILKRLGLWQKRNEKSIDLSGGMKRKLMIARALIHDPKLMILDEPTAGVDVSTRREMWSYIQDLNKKGKTIILTTHYLEEAEQNCKNVAIINHGKIIENTTIKKLIMKLDTQVYVMDIKETKNRPQIPETEFIDESTIKVKVNKNEGLTEKIKQLSDAGIRIMSMRNSTNRLEELFISITGTSPSELMDN